MIGLIAQAVGTTAALVGQVPGLGTKDKVIKDETLTVNNDNANQGYKEGMKATTVDRDVTEHTVQESTDFGKAMSILSMAGGAASIADGLGAFDKVGLGANKTKAAVNDSIKEIDTNINGLVRQTFSPEEMEIFGVNKYINQ